MKTPESLKTDESLE
jgi:hypothetical protein